MTTPRELAEKILGLGWNEDCCGNEHNRAPLESILQEALAEAAREFGVTLTADMHKSIYEQAGEIERLERELKEIRAAALEEAAKIAEAYAEDNFSIGSVSVAAKDVAEAIRLRASELK